LKIWNSKNIIQKSKCKSCGKRNPKYKKYILKKKIRNTKSENILLKRIFRIQECAMEIQNLEMYSRKGVKEVFFLSTPFLT